MLLSLSTCWNSHRCLEGHELVLQAKQVGFDHIEISHVTKPSLMPGLMKSINAGAIQISSLHAPCPPTEELALDAPDRYELTHDDPANREQALKLAQQSIELAAQVRCPIVILHLGTVAMEPITPRLEAMASAGQAYSRAYIEQKLRLVTERAQRAAPYLIHTGKIVSAIEDQGRIFHHASSSRIALAATRLASQRIWPCRR